MGKRVKDVQFCDGQQVTSSFWKWKKTGKNQCQWNEKKIHNQSISLGMYIYNYTGQQKKGYKVIYLLFYKTEWPVLFAYCKQNVCCFRVDLPDLNQVQWSETAARQFEWFCTTCTISPLLGTIEAK